MPIDIDLLLKAYAHGIFPMADSREDEEAFWVEPKHRAILPLDRFHISKSLAKTIRQDRFRVTCDTDFAAIIRSCAERVDTRRETWINGDIEEAFMTLNARGMAHSIECWLDGRLVGGLYGLAMGGAFFGESMFSRATDASKVALAWLVARLRIGGFVLLDCQFMTEHLQSFGTIEVRQESYLRMLAKAIEPCAQVSSTASPSSESASVAGSAAAFSSGRGDWAALDGLLGAAGSSADSSSASSPGKFILHSLTHTS